MIWSNIFAFSLKNLEGALEEFSNNSAKIPTEISTELYCRFCANNAKTALILKCSLWSLLVNKEKKRFKKGKMHFLPYKTAAFFFKF